MAILRKGEYITTVDTAATNEQALTEYMVGRKVEMKDMEIPFSRMALGGRPTMLSPLWIIMPPSTWWDGRWS